MVDLKNYQTIADTARQLRMTIQRVQRAVGLLEIETHLFGSTTVIEKSAASRIRAAFNDGTIRRGRPAGKSSRPPAMRRGSSSAQRSPR